MSDLIDKELTGEVIGGFFTVYNELGFGFNDAIYGRSLAIELRLRGLTVEREVLKEAVFRGQRVGCFRIDLLVERRLVVEVKASHQLADADYRQVLNYLRVSDLQLGLLLHFGPKPAFHRVIWTRPRTG